MHTSTIQRTTVAHMSIASTPIPSAPLTLRVVGPSTRMLIPSLQEGQMGLVLSPQLHDDPWAELSNSRGPKDQVCRWTRPRSRWPNESLGGAVLSPGVVVFLIASSPWQWLPMWVTWLSSDSSEQLGLMFSPQWLNQCAPKAMADDGVPQIISPTVIKAMLSATDRSRYIREPG